MELPNGTILMHGPTPYDPVKAHEYYMRTRQLKGRKPGQIQARPVSRSFRPARNTVTVKLPSGKTVLLTQKQLAEQKAEITRRITQIKANLSRLQHILKVKKREAEDKAAKAKVKASKPPTAAEKSKAARESKQYRKEHRQKLASKAQPVKTKQPELDPVAELEVTIDDIKRRLTAAVQRQRSLMAATRPAKKGR